MEVSLNTVCNRRLLRGLDEIVTRSRENEADLIAYLAEVDKRRLYLEQSYSSMHQYCTAELHFSEGMAYHRITVARASRTYPLLVERIREGTLHLAGAYVLVPKLAQANHVELINAARDKTKRAIEELLADRAPKPDVPTSIRQLPDPRPVVSAVWLDSESTGPLPEVAPREVAPTPRIPRPADQAPSPLGHKRFKIQFTGDQALCDTLREAQGLLRHQIPDGDVAKIFNRALVLLVEDAKRKKFAQTSRPRKRLKCARGSGTSSRHIPAEIKREVAARHGGRCAFVGRNGRRCGSRDFLEFHHIV